MSTGGPFNVNNGDASQGVKNLLSIAQAVNNMAAAMRSSFPQQGAVSTSATAGAQTLPANPAGFIAITLPDGMLAKVPYYND